MRVNITVVGAGAIGGLIAARLAAAGERVTVVARGEHLKAIRAHGLRLRRGRAKPSHASKRPTASLKPATLTLSSSGSRRIS